MPPTCPAPTTTHLLFFPPPNTPLSSLSLSSSGERDFTGRAEPGQQPAILPGRLLSGMFFPERGSNSNS